MKKTLSLLLCALMLLTINLSGVKIFAADDPFDGFSKLTVTPGADNESMNFSWLIEEDQSVGALQYVKKSELGTGFPCEAANTITVSSTDYHNTGYRLCKASISGLQENTEYAYRYGDTVKWSNTYDFSTIKSKNGEFSAVYIGDPQLGVSPTDDDIGFRNTITNAFKTAPNASLVISAGDQDNSESTLERQMRNYSAFFSPAEFSSVPVATVMGNHENRPKYTPLYDRFNNPNSTEYGKSMGGSDYYFKFGNTLFINLNCGTEFLQTDVTEHGKAIKEAVEKYPDARWRVIVMHFDIYGTGKYQSQTGYMINFRNGMVPYIDEYDIDIVFSGHEHLYSRTHFLKNGEVQRVAQDSNGRFQNPDGTIYMTATSSSGNKYYGSVEPRPYYINKYIQEYRPQYNIVAFEKNQLIFNSYFSDTNELSDSFTIVKSEKLEELREAVKTASKIDISGSQTIAAQEIKGQIDNANSTISSGDATDEDYSNALTALQEAVARFEREQTVDLYASAIESQPTVSAEGDEVYFTAIIRNIGEGDSSSGVPVDFYVDGRLIDSVETKETVQSGQMLRVTCSVPYHATFGMHTVSIKIDSSNQFEELDRSNNAIKKRFIVEG